MKRQQRKKFSQHFLNSLKIARRIVSHADVQNRTVVEIGPGKGILTREIARQALQVFAIELDPEMVETVQSMDLFHVRVIHDDFLEHDITQYGDIIVVGNIPYSISSPIIEKLITSHSSVTRAVLTVQREFAQRLLAQPGNRSYGFVSLYLRCFFAVSKLFTITPRFFTPQPAISSVVVRLNRKQALVPSGQQREFFELLRTMFRYPRKSVKNALGIALKDVPMGIEKRILEKRPALLNIEDVHTIYRAIF